MIKTFIIDDERAALDNLERYLKDYEEIDLLASFIDVSLAIDQIENNDIDLVFLDIDMPRMNGIEAAEKILEIDSSIEIVFVTAYNDYAVDAFEVEAIDYIMKPIIRKRLDKTIDRIKRNYEEAIIEKKEIQILCFGNFAILSADDSLKCRTSKAEEFIAYLVHHCGNFVPKDILIEKLWPDKDEKRATKLLHTSVYYARSALKNINLDGAIVYSNKMYKLDMPDVYCDVKKFNEIIDTCQNIKSDNVEKVKELIQVYKGEYFQTNDYLWSMADQSKYRKQYIDTLVALSIYYIGENNYRDALLYLEIISEFDPYSEENHRKLLMTYIKIGNYHKFVRHYEKIKKSFKVDLGEELGKELKKMYIETIKKIK